MVKKAFILLAQQINTVDGQSYLNACIKKITSQGYIPLIPHDYDLFQREFNNIEYFTKICLVTDQVFMFTDFGWDHQMRKMARNFEVEVVRLSKLEKTGLWMFQKQEARA